MRWAFHRHTSESPAKMPNPHINAEASNSRHWMSYLSAAAVARVSVRRRGGGRVKEGMFEPHRDISFSCQHGRARERREERLLTLLRYNYIAREDGRRTDGHRNYQSKADAADLRGSERAREGRRSSFVFRSEPQPTPFPVREAGRGRASRSRQGRHAKQFGRNKSQKTKRPIDRSIDRPTDRKE